MLCMEMRKKASNKPLINKLKAYNLPIVFTSSAALSYFILKANCDTKPEGHVLCSSEEMVITAFFVSMIVTIASCCRSFPDRDWQA